MSDYEKSPVCWKCQCPFVKRKAPPHYRKLRCRGTVCDVRVVDMPEWHCYRCENSATDEDSDGPIAAAIKNHATMLKKADAAKEECKGFLAWLGAMGFAPHTTIPKRSRLNYPSGVRSRRGNCVAEVNWDADKDGIRFEWTVSLWDSNARELMGTLSGYDASLFIQQWAAERDVIDNLPCV